MGKTPAEIGVEVARLYCLAKGIIAVGLSEYDPLVRVVAAAIREDRAEAVSEAEVEAGARAISVNSGKDPDRIIVNEGGRATWTFYSHIVRLVLEAARKARTE